MARFRRDREPVAPTGVRAHLRDVSTVEPPLFYVGDNAEGMHVWEAVLDVDVALVAKVTVETLPARTEIRF